MTTAYTSLLGLALPVTGELSGTWGDVVNNSITSLVDSAVAGTTNVSTDGDVTLTTTTGAANTAREAILLFSGSRTALRTVTAPAQSKIYTVINATTGGYAVKLVGAGPTTGVTIVAGESAVCAWNGSDFVKVSNAGGSSSFVDLTVSGNLTLSGGTANGVLYLNGSKVATSGSALVFDGTNLGIGTSSASQVLDVFANSASIAAFRSTGGSSNDKRLLITSGGDNIRLDSANQSGGAASMAFSIGSTEGMRLTSTGLGIGTSSPSYKLDVVGTVQSTGSGGAKVRLTDNTVSVLNSSATASGYLSFKRSDGTQKAAVGSYYNVADEGNLEFIGPTGSTNMLLNSSGNLGLGVTPSAWSNIFRVMQLGSDGAWVGGRTDSQNQAWLATNSHYNGTNWIYKATTSAGQFALAGNEFRFYQAASGTAGNAITFTQAMTLDASGNLGVGTTSPQTKLDVNGTINVRTNGYEFGRITTNNVSASTGGLTFQYNSAGSFTEGMRLDGGGLLMVGLSSNDGRRFTIAGNTNDLAGIGITYTGVAAGSLAVNSSGALTFNLNNSDGKTERMRIDSSGNLLVGTTSAVGKFTVSSSSGVQIYVNQLTGGSTLALFDFNGATVGSISTNGVTTAYNTSSDYRLKNTIAPMTGALARIAALKPCTYKWNADGSEGEGFIAHELAEVVPQCVTGEKDAVNEDGSIKPQGIDTSFLVATLTAAIQEQQAIIESLKARLDAANL